MEGNLANEVGLVVLDTIELFCGHFKVSTLECFISIVVSALNNEQFVKNKNMWIVWRLLTLLELDLYH